MRKGKILISFVALEILTFIFLMFTSVKGFNLNNIWANIAILFVGMYALIYSILFKLDSELYYGILLICISISSAYAFVNEIPFKTFYPIYLFCVAIAHLTVFVIFRQIIHFKLFAFLLIECILLISYKANLINWWILVGINGAYLFYILINLILRVAKNLRREQ